MATLLNTSAPTITSDLVKDSGGTAKIDLSTMNLGSRVSRKMYSQYSSATQSLTSARRVWVPGPVFPEVTGFKANSLIRLRMGIPGRRDSTSTWGGVFVEPQVSFNRGTYLSLGGSGFDLMMLQDSWINTYRATLLFDPQQTSDFDMQIRFYLATHDPTTTINGSHSINTISGTATQMADPNGNQHWFNIVVEELAELVG